jgi:serine protease Do
MSENDFNYDPNEEKDQLNSDPESQEPDLKPEEPVSDTASEDTKEEVSSEDTQQADHAASSAQEEQPKDNSYQQQNQNPYGQGSYDQNQNSYTQGPYTYGQNQNSYYQSPYTYGQNQNSYYQNPYTYGQNQNSYGQNQNTYGQNQSSSGQSQNTYGQNPNSNGQNQNTYGQNPNSNGQNQYGQSPYTYGQNQNSYWQYRNPYSSYNSPYGNNGNSYGYGQNQNHQQPYWSYQPQNPQGPRPPKKKSLGLKVFLWILGILVVGTVTAFSVYGIITTYEQQNSDPNVVSSQTQPDNDTSEPDSASSSQQKIEGKVSGDGTDPNSSGIVINPIPTGNPLTAKEVYKKVVESVVGVQTTIEGTMGESGESQGTGIVATSDGYILTNAHVVNYSRANKVTVILHNGKKYAATVVGYDKTSDLAVLRINAKNLTPAEFGNSDQLEVGDSVVAIGNPGGMDFASSLTGGMVSAVNRTIESHSDNGMTYIQTDAAINPGNSGGPLVNMYGQVIGINSNKIVATGYEGMGFSIPISQAKTIINDLIARGYVSGRSRLGITAMTITEIQSQLSGYPVGVMIREISDESDLKKSGVVAGDIITKADGQKVTSLDDLYAVLNRHKAGDTITLTIYSPGTSDSTSSTRDVKTKLLEDKGETQTK